MENCLDCFGSNTIKKGFRITQHRGKIQRYYCKDCKKSFIAEKDLYEWKNKFDFDIVNKVLDNYCNTDKSLRQISNEFKECGVDISHTAIMRMSQKYIDMFGDDVWDSNVFSPTKLN